MPDEKQASTWPSPKPDRGEELQLATADAPNIETLKRIDAPAILREFTGKLGPLEKESLALVVTDASQIEIANRADEKRKAIKDLRCAAENKRKELVAGMNKALGEINEGFGEVWDRCTAAEKHLQEQVEFAARAEADRVAKLQAERSTKLRELGAEAHRAEMEKAKAEREAQQKKAQAEHEALMKKNAAEKKAREEAEEAVRKAQQDAMDKQAAEAKARQDAAKAPDREKLVAFAHSLRALEFPKMSTEAGSVAVAKLIENTGKLADWTEKKALEF